MADLTWNDIEKFCYFIASQIQYQGREYTGIYGIPRGGLVPAVMLSHELGIPLVDAPGDGVLVVDDINDTGKTVSEHSEYDIAVLIERESSEASANVVGVIVTTDDWFVFPWESKERAEEDEKTYLESRGIGGRA